MKYRNSCTRPFICESLKTTYFDIKKPIGKVIRKEMNKAAVCDLKA